MSVASDRRGDGVCVDGNRLQTEELAKHFQPQKAALVRLERTELLGPRGP